MTKSSQLTSLCPAKEPIPRGERRRREIVQVAERIFLAHGFTETTMQMVADGAAASKETLYRHFRSKEELFAEIIGNRATRLLARLDADFERPNSIADVLRDLGVNVLTSMTSPETISLLKIVVAESPRDPDLGRIFFSIGPDRTRMRLAEYLTLAQGRGEFVGRSPALAASIFLGAVVAQSLTSRLVLKDPPPMSETEIDERVEEVVAMFLARYGRPSDPGVRPFANE